MDEKNKSIIYLVKTAAYLNRSIPIPLLLFGTVGNVLNICILTRKKLRNNSCSFYFLSSTIANLICLWFGLSTRFLSGYNLDPTAWNTIACKFRYFSTYLALSLSACFLVYASIDRWTSSSTNVRMRLFSRINVAQRMVIYTIIIGLLLYSQAFYCYATISDQFPVNCYCPNVICRMYNDILFLILYSIFPPLLMLGFGWITLKNIKRIRQQVNPNLITNHRYQYLMRRKDRQMLTMLFIQVILFFICVTPSGISKAYTTFTFEEEKDALELTKENFFFQVKLKYFIFIYLKKMICFRYLH
jgi:hypothetical protein